MYSTFWFSFFFLKAVFTMKLISKTALEELFPDSILVSN